MTTMPPETIGLPQSRPLTRDDLDRLRVADDGHRYELVDGVLVVSPSPRHLHQRALGRLHLLLCAVVPEEEEEEEEVLLAPFDVALADDTVMQPDLLVARLAEITERALPAAPVLAVEVLSPSTRSFDLLVKKDRLRRAGCSHYWVVDPDEPAMTAWRLDGEDYALAGDASGDDELVLERPYPVRVTPQRLVDR